MILILFAFLILVLYLYLKHRYSYWKRHGFAYDCNSSIPFGSLKSVSKHEKSMGMAIYDVYKSTKEPFLGVYMLFRPGILIRDPQLAKTVLAQDFGSFHDRGVYVDEKNDPMSATLFAMRGKSWKDMRTKLAPSFTTGKLKGMFGASEDIANKMVNYLNTVIPEQGSAEVDLKDVCVTYAIDIIASVIFGLDINSFENPNNKFRALVGVARRNTLISAIFSMLVFLVPNVAKFFFKLGIRNNVAITLREIIKETIEYREKHGIIRKDMLQLLMQLRNKGEINEDDNNWNAQASEDHTKSLSLEEITAQGLIFYLAGQETTSSTIAFCIFELAQQPELLKQAENEIQDVLAKYSGVVSYESLKDMKFLERCIMETVRKYPLPMLNRECTKDYVIPGTNKTIYKGTPMVISLFGIHRDDEHFPEANKFIPDRFEETNRNYNPVAYMPFGEGPRHCIAQRMGMVNAKLGLVKLLQNFAIEIMEPREIEIDNHSLGIVPKGGVPIRLSKRKLN